MTRTLLRATAVLFAASSLAHAQLSFTDVTVASGLLPSDKAGKEVPMMFGGAAAGDFDNDGWQDLFVLGRKGRPDMLFINNGDGTFTNRAGPYGVAYRHFGSGVTVGDYDGNGWLDIYITSFGTDNSSVGANLLYRNEGNGSFTEVGAAAGVALTSQTLPGGFGTTFGDYDLDGDLDLFVCNWSADCSANHLFRNQGDGTFLDATLAADLDVCGLWGFSPAFVDMDGDRYPELLVAGDFGSSRYLANDGDGTFTRFDRKYGTGRESNGMGHTVGDFNCDGKPDWYVTSIFKGNSITSGNMLYFNKGGHSYVETGLLSGVKAGFWGWGAAAVDLNLDGWEDIVETNGWVNQQWFHKPARLWLNNGDRTFSEVAQSANLDHSLNGRGLLTLDYDNDGDQDVLILTDHIGQMRFYRNDLQNGGNWLRVFLNTRHDPTLAPNGVGARLTLRTGGHRQIRIVHGACTYLSQCELSALFGLGSAGVVDELRTRWPNGKLTQLTGLAVNRTIVVSSP